MSWLHAPLSVFLPVCGVVSILLIVDCESLIQLNEHDVEPDKLAFD